MKLDRFSEEPAALESREPAERHEPNEAQSLHKWAESIGARYDGVQMGLEGLDLWCFTYTQGPAAGASFCIREGSSTPDMNRKAREVFQKFSQE